MQLASHKEASMKQSAFEMFRMAVVAGAFRTVRGEQYNQARRELLERDGEGSVIYEITLPEHEDWATWRDKTLPLMLRYLRARGVDPEYPTAAVVAVFSGQHCHFVEGIRFMNLVREAEGLNAAAWHFRVLEWLSR